MSSAVPEKVSARLPVAKHWLAVSSLIGEVRLYAAHTHSP